MAEALIVLDAGFVVGKTDRRLFGSLSTYRTLCLWRDIRAGHPTADDEGFRQDVLELVRELGVTSFDYPGGNFVSGYNWEDGVVRSISGLDVENWPGSAPRRMRSARQIVAWCAKAEIEPMMAANLGTRGEMKPGRCWNIATWKVARPQRLAA